MRAPRAVLLVFPLPFEDSNTLPLRAKVRLPSAPCASWWGQSRGKILIFARTFCLLAGCASGQGDVYPGEVGDAGNDYRCACLSWVSRVPALIWACCCAGVVKTMISRACRVQELHLLLKVCACVHSCEEGGCGLTSFTRAGVAGRRNEGAVCRAAERRRYVCVCVLGRGGGAAAVSGAAAEYGRAAIRVECTRARVAQVF